MRKIVEVRNSHTPMVHQALGLRLSFPLAHRPGKSTDVLFSGTGNFTLIIPATFF